jgi:hypothetical protein
LAVIEPRADKAGIAVASLLAVSDEIDAGAQLRFDGEPGRVIGGRLKFAFRKAPLQMVVDRLQHPARARPASYSHH